jgi:hypothetical protein
MVTFRVDEITRRVSAAFDYENSSGDIFSGFLTEYVTHSHGTDHPVRYEIDWGEDEPKDAEDAGDQIIQAFVDQGIALE